jgi:hypothetical protein
MAKVSLSKVQVMRVFWEGKGAAVVEKYSTANGDKTTKYSLFFDEPHGLLEGAIIDVEGLLSASVDEYDKRDGSGKGYSVALKVNKPRVSNVDLPVPSNKVNEAAILEQWPTATVGSAEPVDTSAPF